MLANVFWPDGPGASNQNLPNPLYRLRRFAGRYRIRNSPFNRRTVSRFCWSRAQPCNSTQPAISRWMSRPISAQARQLEQAVALSGDLFCLVSPAIACPSTSGCVRARTAASPGPGRPLRVDRWPDERRSPHMPTPGAATAWNGAEAEETRRRLMQALALYPESAAQRWLSTNCARASCWRNWASSLRQKPKRCSPVSVTNKSRPHAPSIGWRSYAATIGHALWGRQREFNDWSTHRQASRNTPGFRAPR